MFLPPNHPQLEAFPDFEVHPPSLPSIPHGKENKPTTTAAKEGAQQPITGRKRSLTIHSAESMSYHNYLESPSSSTFTARQQAQLTSLQFHNNAMSSHNGLPNGGGGGGMNGSINGMGNGGANGMQPNGMVGYPTPAGHQSDLNYVMSMVDELSSVLRQNQALTNSVVEKMGRVRERAAALGSGMSNDEVIAAVAEEMNEESKNLEKQNSDLRAALEKSENNSAENWRLAIYSAQIISDISEKLHKYKETHERDTLIWHKNYRSQLAHERAENLALRQQINDMKASANRANGHLRELRKWHNENDEIQELKGQVQMYRLERRYWKRMALPLLEDDDEEFSGDDDLVDEVEKMREGERSEQVRLANERMLRDERESVHG